MPRKFLKHYLPDADTLHTRRELRFLGKLLEDPYLFHLNRRSVSGGTAVGLFVAFMPIPGQMLIAGGLAILLRINLLIAVALVWVSNPLTTPAIFYFCHRLGNWLLRRPLTALEFHPSLAWFWERLEIIWAPFLLGCLVVGLGSALLGSLAVRIIWRLHVFRAIRLRRQRFARRPTVPPPDVHDER
ncbi:MAG: DUF2062 domain-containing protein [Gammaproteobacteria bacterium]|nr:DUF2062 domain-containing protein [Gammaproteobacteria bacterium]